MIDPMEYAKRSRGRSKRGRGTQHIGRVWEHQAKARSKGKKRVTAKKEAGQLKKVVTAFRYVDIWAGLVLIGKGVSAMPPCPNPM